MFCTIPAMPLYSFMCLVISKHCRDVFPIRERLYSHAEKAPCFIPLAARFRVLRPRRGGKPVLDVYSILFLKL